MNKKQRHELFVRFQQQNPKPTTELVYHSPFELLIAVILSAQATDVSVNKATFKLFPIANTPQAILDLGIEKLKPYIQSIDLYNSKAQNIIKTCALLLEKHGGQVPDQREQLEALPGVGRKTANVVLNTAFGKAIMAVDTHIFRLANRINLGKGKTPLEVEKKLTKTTPKEFLKDAHHLLILHGRYTCKAQKPNCLSCCINHLCEYKYKNI